MCSLPTLRVGIFATIGQSVPKPATGHLSEEKMAQFQIGLNNSLHTIFQQSSLKSLVFWWQSWLVTNKSNSMPQRWLYQQHWTILFHSLLTHNGTQSEKYYFSPFVDAMFFHILFLQKLSQLWYYGNASILGTGADEDQGGMKF